MIKISIKKKYGWRTLNLAAFFRMFSMSQRKSLVSNTTKAQVVDTGRCLESRDALLFLEKLEMQWIQSLPDHQSFLELYGDGKYRNHVLIRQNQLKSEQFGDSISIQLDHFEQSTGEKGVRFEGPLAEAMSNVALYKQDSSVSGYFVLIPESRLICDKFGNTQIVSEFFLDLAPVTNQEYARYVADNDVLPPDSWGSDTPPEELLNHPVVNVALEDAQAYAKWCGCRLPTSMEWKAASQCGIGGDFPWFKNNWNEDRCNNPETGPKTTTPVNAFPDGVSRYGCLDLVGNVWEWTFGESLQKELEEGYAWVYGGSYKHSVVGDDGIAETQVLVGNSYPYLGFRCAADSLSAG